MTSTFDHSTSKWGHGTHLSSASFLPIFGFLCRSVHDLGSGSISCRFRHIWFRKYHDLEMTQGHQTGTIQQNSHGFLLVFYRNFVPKTHHFQIFAFEKYRDLETGLTGNWRSLKMTLFDTPPMISYLCCIVTIALYRVVSEIFNVENIVTLKSRSEVIKGLFYLFQITGKGQCHWHAINKNKSNTR